MECSNVMKKEKRDVSNITKIGPFFFIEDRLLFNACVIDKGRCQADMIDNPFSHKELFREYDPRGEYIFYPRGRVVWDAKKQLSVIYIDPCINTGKVIDEIVRAFCVVRYMVEYDDHYRCRNCIDKY